MPSYTNFPSLLALGYPVAQVCLRSGLYDILPCVMALEIPKAKLKSFVRHVVPGECCNRSNNLTTRGSLHLRYLAAVRHGIILSRQPGQC